MTDRMNAIAEIWENAQKLVAPFSQGSILPLSKSADLVIIGSFRGTHLDEEVPNAKTDLIHAAAEIMRPHIKLPFFPGPLEPVEESELQAVSGPTLHLIDDSITIQLLQRDADSVGIPRNLIHAHSPDNGEDIDFTVIDRLLRYSLSKTTAARILAPAWLAPYFAEWMLASGTTAYRLHIIPLDRFNISNLRDLTIKAMMLGLLDNPRHKPEDDQPTE